MNFTVIWQPAALNALADIWTTVTDRNAVTDASEQIDRMLTRDPLNVGESRPGNQRVAFAFPLGVRYEVVLDDRRSVVVAVWLTRMV
jgi:hypothetical protein